MGKKTNGSNEPKKEKKDDGIVFDGTVVEALKGRFRVEVQSVPDGPVHEVIAHLAGKMRKFGIKIVPGDKVSVELSPYDISRGRIVYRLKN